MSHVHQLAYSYSTSSAEISVIRTELFSVLKRKSRPASRFSFPTHPHLLLRGRRALSDPCDYHVAVAGPRLTHAPEIYMLPSPHSDRELRERHQASLEGHVRGPPCGHPHPMHVSDPCHAVRPAQQLGVRRDYPVALILTPHFVCVPVYAAVRPMRLSADVELSWPGLVSWPQQSDRPHTPLPPCGYMRDRSRLAAAQRYGFCADDPRCERHAPLVATARGLGGRWVWRLRLLRWRRRHGYRLRP